jgi:transposase
VPKAIPYGVYDVGADAGLVCVGVDHDTAPFAVNAIRTWWQRVGRTRYPLSSMPYLLSWRTTPAFDKDIYRERNQVERCFNRLKHWRDLATRCGKRASIYRACLVLIAALLWLR